MSQSFEDLVDLLLGDKPPLVWSLLVTVFGDLAQDEGAELSGVLIGRLTALMRVRPEANRVALHRLRKDGWIESRRIGRNSLYRLSSEGLRETRAASPRIYGLREPGGQAWLILGDPERPKSLSKGVPVFSTLPHLRVVQTRPDDPDIAAFDMTDAEQLPNWLRNRLVSADLVSLAAGLCVTFRRVDAALTRQDGPMDAIQTAVLRVLIVHAWRRLALKAPPLPDRLFPDRMPLRACRDVKASLLARLPMPVLVHSDGDAGQVASV